MRVALLKKLPGLIAAAVILLTPLSAVAAEFRPYFKTFGSDVMTGGWFANGTNCQTGGAYYQDNKYNSSADSRTGGILAYAKQSGGNAAGGSSSQYGMYSLGAIDGDNGVNGFYSGGALAATAPTSRTYLTFANDNAARPWGGIFEGSVRQSNCLPDYYSERPGGATSVNSLNDAVAAGGNGIYGVTAGVGAACATPSTYCLTTGNVTIPAGLRITIYASGNVYIPNNITYAASDATNVPKFSLVVRGSIYVDPAVTQLDGFYIAQPDPANSDPLNSDTGILWTCHNNTSSAYPYTDIGKFCTNRLVINGAVVAKQVNFLRLKGDIGAASTAEDTLAGALGSSNIAEIINYVPQNIVGGNFFSSNGANSSNGLPVDSIISLPPVF